jgi:hypothetical protein
MAEQFVDVTYRGLEVGHRLKLTDFGPHTAYLELATPMPVGSAIELVDDDGGALTARVVRVHEQVAGADLPPGMRIHVAEVPGWWQPLVGRDDPSIPEPATRPPEPPAEAAAPEPPAAAPEQPVVAEQPPAAEEPPAAEKGGEDGVVAEPADSARQTTVMSTAAIHAAIADIEGGAPSDDDDDAHNRTQKMSAAALEQALAAEEQARASAAEDGDGDGDDSNGDSDGNGAPRGKRKRRRRKRKTRA